MPDYVVRALITADDLEAAETLAIQMMVPALYGALYWHEVTETNELLPMDEQASALLAQADGTSFALRPAGTPPPGFRWDGEQWLYSSDWLSPPEE